MGLRQKYPGLLPLAHTPPSGLPASPHPSQAVSLKKPFSKNRQQAKSTLKHAKGTQDPSTCRQARSMRPKASPRAWADCSQDAQLAGDKGHPQLHPENLPEHPTQTYQLVLLLPNPLPFPAAAWQGKTGGTGESKRVLILDAILDVLLLTPTSMRMSDLSPLPSSSRVPHLSLSVTGALIPSPFPRHVPPSLPHPSV